MGTAAQPAHKVANRPFAEDKCSQLGTSLSVQLCTTFISYMSYQAWMLWGIFACLPGGEAECRTGYGIMGWMCRTRPCGLFSPLFSVQHLSSPRRRCSSQNVQQSSKLWNSLLSISCRLLTNFPTQTLSALKNCFRFRTDDSQWVVTVWLLAFTCH